MIRLFDEAVRFQEAYEERLHKLQTLLGVSRIKAERIHTTVVLAAARTPYCFDFWWDRTWVRLVREFT